MTDTIEAAIQAIRDFDDPGAELAAQYARIAITAHTKALIEGAGEQAQVHYNYGSALASTDGEGAWEQVARDAAVHILQAAATIAAQKAEIERLTEREAQVKEALKPFADCVEQIAADEDDEEWAKFRLLIKDYRRAARALDAEAIAKGEA